MTRYLLDTNILSNLVKPEPSESLIAWMAERNDVDLYIASLTLAEINRGILEKPVGRKRTELETWFAGPEGPEALFWGRILPFDVEAARHWAVLMSDGAAVGRSRSALDMIIASVALANNCKIVTDNEKDFWGLRVINPLRPLS